MYRLLLKMAVMKTLVNKCTIFLILQVIAANFAWAQLVKWNGNVSGDWNNSLNWNGGVVPSVADSVIINASLSQYPDIASSASCGYLQIDAGAFLSMSPGGTLAIYGDMINEGGFDAGNETVVFGANTLILNDLTLNHVVITGTLIAPSGTLAVTGNWENNGTFIHNNGTLNFSGIDTIKGNAESNFYSVVINGTLVASPLNIRVAGNWSNDGVFDHNNGTISFNGDLNQDLGGANTTYFYNMVIDKSSSEVILDNNTGISNEMQLLNGFCRLNAFRLTIENPSPAAITRSNGFIISETVPDLGYSYLQWNVGITSGVYLFPFVSSDGIYVPFIFDITGAGSDPSGVLAVATYNTNPTNNPYPSGVTNINDSAGSDNSVNTVDRYWVITPLGYSVNPVATVTFTVTPAEAATISNLKVQHWNGVSWDSPLIGDSMTANCVRLPGISSFSPFTLSGQAVALPTELISFEARRLNEEVQLHWVTATETNNAFFSVERTFGNTPSDFAGLSVINGAGNASSVNQYSFVDNNIPAVIPGGEILYRLKQTDFNGKEKYSGVVKVKMLNDLSKNIEVYPNPSDGRDIHIAFEQKTAGIVLVVIKDMSGREAFTKLIPLYNNEDGVIAVNASPELVPGIYFVVASSDNNIYQQKLVVR